MLRLALHSYTQFKWNPIVLCQSHPHIHRPDGLKCPGIAGASCLVEEEPMPGAKSPFQRRHPPEMRERAVRMVQEAIAESRERVGAVTRVARQLGNPIFGCVRVFTVARLCGVQATDGHRDKEH